MTRSRTLWGTALAALVAATALTLGPVPGAAPALAATSLTSTTPTAVGNASTASAVRVVFRGADLPATATARLAYVADPGSSTAAALTLVGSTVSATTTAVTADFDVRGAAPQSYEPRLVSPDGTSVACACRVQVVAAGGAVGVTSLDVDPATTGVQRTVRPGTSPSVLLTGSALARGTTVVVAGGGVAVRDVRYVDASRLSLGLDVAGTAASGLRDVTVTRTDGSSARCAGCLEVQASPTATPAPTPSRTTTPTPTATPAQVVLQGPAEVERSERAYVVTGRGAPSAGYTAEVLVQGQAQRLEAVTADRDGVFAFSVSAVADATYRLLDRSGRQVAAGATRAVGTTLVTPDAVVPAGRVLTLVGRARAGEQVDVWFRAAGQTAFTDRRDLVAAADGRWSTTFTADRDHRYYATSSEGQSRTGLVQAGFVRLAGPRQVRAGATAVLTGRVHPVRPVQVAFRRAGSSSYVVRRTVTPGRDGAFRTSFTPDVDHAYYATTGVATSPRLVTKVVRPAPTAPRPAPAPGPGPADAPPPPPPPSTSRCHPDYVDCVPVKGDGSGVGEANDLDCGDPGVPSNVVLRGDRDRYRLDNDDPDSIGCET